MTATLENIESQEGSQDMVDRPIGLSAWLWAVQLAIVISMPAKAEELAAFVAARAGALEVLHGKAERSLVGVAQDPSYREFFRTVSEDDRQKLKERIDQISLETQSKFDVGEMCLIDARGHEVSRIVEGEVADDLSTEEAQNIFFKPGFEQAPRTAYVSPVYISPDVHRWVIGYVTPIDVDGEKKALLHYEHDLAAFQELLRHGLSDDRRFLLAVATDGWIIADSRRAIATEQKGDSTAPTDYFEAFTVDGRTLAQLKDDLGERGHASVALDGAPHDIAWQTVKHWTLVGFEEQGG